MTSQLGRTAPEPVEPACVQCHHSPFQLDLDQSTSPIPNDHTDNDNDSQTDHEVDNQTSAEAAEADTATCQPADDPDPVVAECEPLSHQALLA